MKSRTAKLLLHLAALIGMIAATAAPALAIAARPVQPFAVAAVFPPWWTGDRVRSAIDPMDAVTSEGRLATVVVVYGGSGLEQRLRTAGAWMILDPRIADCGQDAGARS